MYSYEQYHSYTKAEFKNDFLLGRGHNTALRSRIAKIYDAAQRFVEISDEIWHLTIRCATSFLRYDAATQCCGFAHTGLINVFWFHERSARKLVYEHKPLVYIY